MKVKINGKWFEGKFFNCGFDIPLVDEEDIKFFYKWQKKAYNLSKADYVEDIECKGICELVLLKNCRPSLGLNEDTVTLMYDSVKIIEVYG